MQASQLNKNTVLVVMVSVFAVLLLLHLYHLYLYYTADNYLRFLDFNKEHNLPTFFATLNLAFSGYLLIAIARQKDAANYRRSWFLLGFIFFFLAIDEYGMVHDGLFKDKREDLAEFDYLYFVWVIPYGILLLVFAITFLKFFLHLPRKYQWLFGLSGFIFVLGAFGFEILGASRAKNYDRDDYLNIAFTTTEECLEFIGIILFNFSLLSYIEEQHEVSQGILEESD